MGTHVKVLAALAFVAGALGLLFAAFSSIIFGALATVIGRSHEDGAAAGVALVGLTGAALAATLATGAIASLVCGWGLLRRRRWARILGIILAAFALIQFPIGTVFGVYALWVLFNKQTEQMFA